MPILPTLPNWRRRSSSPRVFQPEPQFAADGAFAAASAAHALSEVAGLALDSFRPEHVAECIRRSIAREQVGDLHALRRRLASDRDARARFRRSVAVSVTALFRDPAQFDAIDRLLEGDRRVRVWSAGCANGAELNSAAILLARRDLLDGCRLLGSDVLEENIELARAGASETAELPPEVRRHTRWEVRDLVADGPAPGCHDLILCRNVAIYLAPHAKEVLQRHLASALAPGGLLVLGRAERLLEPSRLGLAEVAPHIYRAPA